MFAVGVTLSCDDISVCLFLPSYFYLRSTFVLTKYKEHYDGASVRTLLIVNLMLPMNGMYMTKFQIGD